MQTIKNKHIITVLFLIGLLQFSPAQATPQWQQITTPHFYVVFPPAMAREANRVANSLEYLYFPVSQSLRAFPKRITVILRNQTVISNGFFTAVPRKIALFTFPSQAYNFVHVNDWLNMLAVHEFRHAVQHAAIKKGFNKLLYALGGESLLANWKYYNIPHWFSEGDAVGIETALTKGGRGRIPYFGVLYKANLLEKGGFSYQKQIFNSYKDAIPDDYKVGYYITTHLRRKYGKHVLSDIINATNMPMLFPSAVEKVTGKSLLEIYQDTNQELKALWTQQIEGLHLTSVDRLNKREEKPVYTDYLYPQPWNNGIIALKQGLDDEYQFVWIDQDGQEKTLLKTGYITEEAGFSIAGDQLVWIEKRFDGLLRDLSSSNLLLSGNQKFYSVIQSYDLKNKNLKTLTPKGRYATATLSHDAKQIIALESDEAYNHQLVILDAHTGQALQRLPNPDNHYYFHPRFTPDGKHIMVIQQANQQATLVWIAIATGNSQILIPPTDENMGHPVMIGDYVFYNSAYSGIDNIYALDLRTNKRYQVTSRKYGAYHAAISKDQQHILCNDFTKDGMDVVQMPFQPKDWIPLEKVDIRKVDYYEPLVEQENNPNILEQIPDHQYTVQPYYPIKNLINIHSWLPYWKVENNSKKESFHVIGLTLYSENLLKTLLWKNTYEYNINRQMSDFSTQLTYQGWYPHFIIGGQLNKLQQSSYLGVIAPFFWMQSNYNYHVRLQTTSKFMHQNSLSFYNQSYQAKFLRASHQSPRDIKPTWKQIITTYYTHPPFQINKPEKQWGVKAGLRCRGLYKHHSLGIKGNYDFTRVFQMNKHRIQPLGNSSTYRFKADYVFPLYYPDWSEGLLYYSKLLTNKFFYESSYSLQEKKKTTYNHHLGTALTWQFYLFSLPQPFYVGIKCHYDLAKASPFLGINFNKGPFWGVYIGYGLSPSKNKAHTTV